MTRENRIESQFKLQIAELVFLEVDGMIKPKSLTIQSYLARLKEQ